jgi:hypothetical protein
VGPPNTLTLKRGACTSCHAAERFTPTSERSSADDDQVPVRFVLKRKPARVEWHDEQLGVFDQGLRVRLRQHQRAYILGRQSRCRLDLDAAVESAEHRYGYPVFALPRQLCGK